jgi:hypothetical protein
MVPKNSVSRMHHQQRKVRHHNVKPLFSTSLAPHPIVPGEQQGNGGHSQGGSQDGAPSISDSGGSGDASDSTQQQATNYINQAQSSLQKCDIASARSLFDQQRRLAPHEVRALDQTVLDHWCNNFY